KMVTKADGMTMRDMAGRTDLIVSTDPEDFIPFPIPPTPADPSDMYIDRPYSVPWQGASWFDKTPSLQLAPGTIMNHTYQGKVYQLRWQLQPVPVWIQVSA